MNGNVEVAEKLPPLPPGFRLVEPEPPPGFRVEEKAEIPPLPPGFRLETEPQMPEFGATASIQPKTQETPPLSTPEPDLLAPGPAQGPPRPYPQVATRFSRPGQPEALAEQAKMLGQDISRIPRTTAETGKTFLGRALTGGSRFMADLDARADQIDAVVKRITGQSMKGGIFKELSEKFGYWGPRLEKEGIKTPVVKDIIGALGQAAFDVPAIVATGGLVTHGALTGFQGDKSLVGTLLGGVSGGLLHGIMKGTAVLPKPFKDAGNFLAFAVTSPGNIKDRLVSGIVGGVLGRTGPQRDVTPQEFLAAYPKIKARIDDKVALRIIQESYPDLYKPEIIAAAGGPRQTLDKIIIAYDLVQKERAADESRIKAQMEEAEAEKAQVVEKGEAALKAVPMLTEEQTYQAKLAAMSGRPQSEGRTPEEIETFGTAKREVIPQRPMAGAPKPELPKPAKPAKEKPYTLSDRVPSGTRHFFKPGFPKDAPQLWIDVMLITGGQGVKDPEPTPSGKPSEEFMALPKVLRNNNSKYGLDIVAQALQKDYPKYEGQSNSGEMLRQDLVDAGRYRPEGELELERQERLGEEGKAEYDEAINRKVKFLQMSDAEKDAEIQRIIDEMEGGGKVVPEKSEAAEPEGEVSREALEFKPEEFAAEPELPERLPQRERLLEDRGKPFKTWEEEAADEASEAQRLADKPLQADRINAIYDKWQGFYRDKGWLAEKAKAAAETLFRHKSSGNVFKLVDDTNPNYLVLETEPGKTIRMDRGFVEPVGKPGRVEEQRSLYGEEPPRTAEAEPRGEITPEQKAWLDKAFPEAVERLGVRYETRGALYERAVRTFRFKENPEENGPALDAFIKNMEYLDKTRYKYKPLSEGERTREHPKGTVKQPLPLPEVEKPGDIALKPGGEVSPEKMTRDETAIKALDILDRFADEDTRTALREIREGIPLDESALIGKAGGRSTVAKIRENVPKAGRLIYEAFNDQAARAEASARVKGLEAKIRAGRALTKQESFDLMVSKAISEGPEGVELGMFFAKIPPEFKAAMKKMGDSVRPKAEDTASAAKTAGEDIIQRAKELFRSPYWNKTTSPFTKFLVKNDAEASRVMNSAERKAKNYIYASKHDVEMAKRINDALIEEDRTGALLPESELRRKFNFTDADVEAHRGVRSAIRLMQKYEMHKSQVALRNHLQGLLKKESPTITAAVWRTIEKGVGDPGFTQDLIKRVPNLLEKRERSGLLSDAEKADILAGEYLKDRSMIRSRYKANPGYVPHSRFGRFAVRIKGVPVDKAGVLIPGGKAKTADFEMFDQESQANRFRQGYRVGETVDFEGQKFEITEISEPIDMSKAGVTPEGFMRAVNSFPLYEKMLERRGIKDEEIEKVMKALGEETLRYFAKGRLAKRANIAGWSKDIAKNLEDFFASFPHAINRRYSIHEATKMIEGMPEAARPYADRLLQYWQGKNPRDILAAEPKWNQSIRSLVYNWYLGFKPSFYFVNAFQPIMTELPLAQKEIGGRALPEFYKASEKSVRIVRDWARARKQDPLANMVSVIEKAPYLSTMEKRAASRMAEGGEIGAARTREIIGKSKITGPASWFGEISEKQNRLHGALYGARIAAIKGLKGNEAIDFAREFTGKSEFVYNKATRMEAMRGAMAPITMFKSYLTNYWNLQAELFKTDKKAFATSMAILLALGGTAGLPLADIGEDVIVRALRLIGVLDDEKRFRQEKHDFLTKVDDTTKNLLRHGLPALANIMGDQAFGAGELLGIAPLQAAKGIQRFAKGIAQPRGADWKERVARMAPTEPKHIVRLYQLMHDKTMPTDEYGRPKLTEDDLKVMPKEMRAWAIENWKKLPKAGDIGAFEKIAYGLGFPTIKMAKYQEGVYAIKGVAREVRTEKGSMNREVGKLIASGIPPSAEKWLLEAKPKQFEDNFNSLISKLDPEARDKIREIVKEANKKKYRLDWGSVLTSVKDYLRKGE